MDEQEEMRVVNSVGAMYVPRNAIYGYMIVIYTPHPRCDRRMSCVPSGRSPDRAISCSRTDALRPLKETRPYEVAWLSSFLNVLLC